MVGVFFFCHRIERKSLEQEYIEQVHRPDLKYAAMSKVNMGKCKKSTCRIHVLYNQPRLGHRPKLSGIKQK